MWFTETPWPPILFCAVLGALSLAAWRAQGQNRYLLGLPLFLILGVAIYAIERAVVTERERVEIALDGLIGVFQKECETNSSVLRAMTSPTELKTLDFISSAAMDVRQKVWTTLLLVDRIEHLRITDVQITMKSANSRALCHFRANAQVRVRTFDFDGHHPSRWMLTWQREGGEWKVIRVQRLDVFTGEAIDTLAPQ